MALVEIQPSARKRAELGTKKVASLEPHGGGRAATPAARGILGALARAVKNSIWAPIALKALGVLLGMLALAAIGASSIARGDGVAANAPSARPGSRVAAAGVAPFDAPPDAGTGAAADAGGDAAADAAAGTSAAITSDGKVILNRAGVDDLRRIPGIGPKRAQAIVDLRAKLGGRFKRLGDLLRVKGIGTRSLKKMEAYVVLDVPQSESLARRPTTD
ncbi:MAG TPA: helix-hairpin-helix domain-containing protein [Polyangiaceae bacterium]|nr:helix-hairpin-helix domain-containing protein [Polyangiaceae bacterium]